MFKKTIVCTSVEEHVSDHGLLVNDLQGMTTENDLLSDDPVRVGSQQGTCGDQAVSAWRPVKLICGVELKSRDKTFQYPPGQE